MQRNDGEGQDPGARRNLTTSAFTTYQKSGPPPIYDSTEVQESTKRQYAVERDHTDLLVYGDVENMFETHLGRAPSHNSHQLALGQIDSLKFSVECLRDDFIGDFDGMDADSP